MTPDNPEPERMCHNCKWLGAEGFHDSEPVVVGRTCRRRAPLVTGGMMSATRTVWPVVALTDWCGDFEHKF